VSITQRAFLLSAQLEIMMGRAFFSGYAKSARLGEVLEAAPEGASRPN